MFCCIIISIKTTSRGFISSAVIIAVIVLLVLGGGYYLITNQSAVFSSGGITSTTTGNVDTSGAFSASPTSGNAPLTVSFSTSYSVNAGGPSYTIQFGDGQSGSIANDASGTHGVASHVYSQAGRYTAELIRVNTCSTVGCVPAPSSVVGAATVVVK